MNFSPIILGTKKKDISYIHRPGAYGIFVNEEALIALVEDDQLLFLPGGGIEKNETPKECLKREVKEELGAKVNILWEIGQAGEYIYTGKAHQRNHYFKEGHFYCVDIMEFGQLGPAEHNLVWLPLEAAIAQMSHKSHAWALEQVQKVSQV